MIKFVSINQTLEQLNTSNKQNFTLLTFIDDSPKYNSTDGTDQDAIIFFKKLKTIWAKGEFYTCSPAIGQVLAGYTTNGINGEVASTDTILGAILKLQVLVNAKPSTNTTYTFKGGTNEFTVTPSGGSAQHVAVTPSIADNVIKTGTISKDHIILGSSTDGVVEDSGKTISTAVTSSSKDTTIPTSKAVWSAIASGIAANDAMVYKGTIAGGSTGTYGALTGAANKGETYKVSSAGKINGIAVEVGDMLICNTDNTAAATSSNFTTIASNWDIIQTNIDGAVTGPASSVDNRIAVFNGINGKIIKDSGYTIGTSVPSNAVFTDSHTNKDGHYTPTTDSDSNKSANASGGSANWNTSVVTGVTLSTDGKGHITDVSVTSSKIPSNPNTDNTAIKLGTVSGAKKSDSTVITAGSSTGLVIEGGTNLFKIGNGINYIEVPITPSVTDNNQTVKAGKITFGANDAIGIVAGNNITVTGNSTQKTITIAADYKFDGTYNSSSNKVATVSTVTNALTWEELN